MERKSEDMVAFPNSLLKSSGANNFKLKFVQINKIPRWKKLLFI